MATNFFADVENDPRIQKAKGLAQAPAPQAGPPPVAQPASSGDFFADAAGDPRVQKSAVPPIVPPPTGDQQDPGFWKAAWNEINPIPAIQGLMDTRRQLGVAKDEYMKTHSGVLGELGWEANAVGQIGKGLLTGTIDKVKEIGADVGAGRYRTAAGKVTGIVGPALVGGAVRKFLPATPKLPKPVAAANKATKEAEAAYTSMRGKLPSTPGPVLQTEAKQAGKAGMRGAYEQFEGARQAAREAAKGRYAIYDKALAHPANTIKASELELKPASFKLDVDGNLRQVTPAITNTTPWHSPVKVDAFKGPLEELVDHDLRFKGAFGPGHPVRQFLDILGDQKGYDYIEFDRLKKGLGKLSKFARTEGKPATMEQLLAHKILDKARPVMMDELKKLAKASKDAKKTDAQAFRSVKNAMEGGDEEWAKYIAAFNEKPAILKRARREHVLETAATTTTSKGIPPAKGLRTVEAAVRQIEPAEEAASAAAALKKTATKYKANEDWVKYYTSNASNLEGLLEGIGRHRAPELLANVVDHIHDTKDWGRWKSMKPEVVSRLTAHQPDLANTIPQIFNKLAEAEKMYGAEPAQSALRQAIAAVQGAHTTKVGRALMPKAVTITADVLSTILGKQDSARKLNQALTTQLARVPTSRKLVRGAGKALELSPLGAPARGLAEPTPPPE